MVNNLYNKVIHFNVKEMVYLQAQIFRTHNRTDKPNS